MSYINLANFTKHTTKDFKASDVFIETYEKNNVKEKSLYINIKDNTTKKQIFFEPLDEVFVPFGCNSSKEYPDSYSITTSFNENNLDEINFFNELKKLEEMILDHIEKDSKLIFKKKLTKEVIVTADKFKSGANTIVSKTNGNTYHQINLKVSSNKEDNKPSIRVFTKSSEGNIEQVNFDKLNKDDSWAKMKSLVYPMSKCRILIIPMISLRNGCVKLGFNANQILANEPVSVDTSSVFGFTVSSDDKFEAKSKNSANDELTEDEEEEDEEEEDEEEEDDEEDDDDEENED